MPEALRLPNDRQEEAALIVAGLLDVGCECAAVEAASLTGVIPTGQIQEYEARLAHRIRGYMERLMDVVWPLQDHRARMDLIWRRVQTLMAREGVEAEWTDAKYRTGSGSSGTSSGQPPSTATSGPETAT